MRLKTSNHIRFSKGLNNYILCNSKTGEIYEFDDKSYNLFMYIYNEDRLDIDVFNYALNLNISREMCDPFIRFLVSETIISLC